MRLLMLFTTVFAEGEQAADNAAQQAPSMLTPILYIIAMFAIFYFLLIRPQRKREKDARLMLESLQMGDKVVTVGGIHGKITQLKDDTVILETGALGNTSTVKVARSSIREVLTVKDQ